MVSQSKIRALPSAAGTSPTVIIREDAVYNALPSSQSIRLLYLCTGNVNETLVAHLETTTVERAPPYEAMSYVWGDAGSREQLIVGTTSVDIPANLHLGLQRVRHPSKCRVLWVDAECL
jgi:hypothetical protein